MYGDKVLANSSSFVGNIGFYTTPWMMKEFLNYWEVEGKYIHKGKNKVRFNRLEEFKEEDV
jgi:ClpP class serine protease